jgi:hypothetical protein
LDEGSSGKVATGLIIRKYYFTASLESQFPFEDETKEESGVGQGLLILAKPELETAEPVELTSFEERVLQALQA